MPSQRWRQGPCVLAGWPSGGPSVPSNRNQKTQSKQLTTVGALSPPSRFYAEGLTQPCWEEGTAAPRGRQAGTCSPDTPVPPGRVCKALRTLGVRPASPGGQREPRGARPPGRTCGGRHWGCGAEGAGGTGSEDRGGACGAETRDPRSSRPRPLCSG